MIWVAIYIIGVIISFLLLAKSASWFLTTHNIWNIFKLSLLSFIMVAAIILIMMYDIEVED